MRRPTAVSILLLLVVILALAAAAVTVARIRHPPEQPVAFNHVLHLEDVGLDCTDCHRYAESGIHATVPNIEVCGDCHADQIGDSPEEKKLVEYVREGKPVPWFRVYWVPDHVFFSHRRHTHVAEIECEACHGAMSQRKRPLSVALKSLRMKDCMACHAEMGVSNDCILCHR